MADFDLLVVGEINPDIVVSDPDPRPVFGQAERIVEAVRLAIGSSSAIAACGGSRLGLRTAMVGVVGDDAFGRFMVDALGRRGVDTSACRVAVGRPSGASVILGNATDRAILTAMGTIGDLRADDIPRSLVGRTRHLHVGSLFLQPALARGLPDLFRVAHEAGATTSIDTNWDPAEAWDGGFREAAAEADVLLPNASEARHLSGEDDLLTAARALGALGPDRHGGAVAVKLGADGALLAWDGTVLRQPARSVTAVDTTGAGDSFDAGFLAGLLLGQGPEDAVRLAVAAGSLSTRAHGGTDGQATLEEAAALAAALPPAEVLA